MLRLMLNQVPQIAAPHPPHILQIFSPLLPKYGNLELAENFKLLATDICNYVKANPVSWEMDDALEPHALVARCKHHSLIDLYQGVYELYAERHRATMWCCKSMANLYFIPQIEQHHLNPIYIHLVRDGRDVAASFKKAIVGEKHIYHLAKQWKQDQETAEQYCRKYAEARYIIVAYEDLINHAEETLKQLLSGLHLAYDNHVLDFYKTDEARHTAEAGKMWTNVTRPVMTRNYNKFIELLTPQDISIFESIAGTTLQHYGYKPYADSATYKAHFTDIEIATFDALNKQMKEEAMLKLDPEGRNKRKAQEAIVEKIKAR